MHSASRTWRLTRTETILWSISSAAILAAFLAFDRRNYLTLCASLTGVASLIFNAKGNPIGQALMLLFSILYGVLSYGFAYYGEMLTYLGMTAPMAAFSLISWLRHPYAGQRAEVQVGRLFPWERLALPFITAAVTAAFGWLLALCHTANLIPSILSVATSFLAAYLTFRRSACFAAAYAVNDLVLILLWILAAHANPNYWTVAVCFAAFFANDLYGFFSWQKMRRRQEQ